MGELGAFLKITRVPAPERDPRERVARLQGDLRGPARGRGGPPGRALHGVRRAVLPRRLPARQPDPGLERPRLQGPLARGDRAAPRDEQLPRVHRADLPGAVRARVRARHQRRPGLDQADRAGDRRARVGGGLDRPAAARAAHRPQRRRRRLRPGRASPPPSSSTARATTSSSTSATRAPAGCCASACPTSSSRSGTSTAASRLLEARGRALRVRRRRRRPTSPPSELSARHDAVVLAIGSRVHRALDVPGADLQGVRFAMDYLYARNRWVARGDAARRRPRADARPASTSS